MLLLLAKPRCHDTLIVVLRRCIVPIYLAYLRLGNILTCLLKHTLIRILIIYMYVTTITYFYRRFDLCAEVFIFVFFAEIRWRNGNNVELESNGIVIRVANCKCNFRYHFKLQKPDVIDHKVSTYCTLTDSLTLTNFQLVRKSRDCICQKCGIRGKTVHPKLNLPLNFCCSMIDFKTDHSLHVVRWYCLTRVQQ